MKIVVLGGAGAMGQVTVRDLSLSDPVTEVVIADFSKERADKVKAKLGGSKITTTKADINDKKGLVAVLKGATAVINSTPYKMNVQVMEAALEAGCHYLDLGGLFHVTRKQLELNDKFKEKNLLAVLGMGAAPGMTNVMAAHACNELERVESIDIYCAGVDFVQSGHPYMPPYALDTILDEYVMEPMVFDDGRFVAKPPMSGEVELDLPHPVGRVKSFLTLHSEVATLPVTYAAKGVKRCTYRLGLPEEFHERSKFLVELGLGATKDLKVGNVSVNPRNVLAALIDQHPVPDTDPEDCEVLRVDVVGMKNGRPATVRMESVIFWHEEWKISCGGLDTGVPPSIVAQMIGLGVIQHRGVLPPESCVPPELFFLEAAKRNIVMRRVIDETLAQNTNKNSTRNGLASNVSR